MVRNKRQVRQLLDAGTWHGFPVVDGDKTDARYTERGAWAVLYNKAGNKADEHGFIVDLDNPDHPWNQE